MSHQCGDARHAVATGQAGAVGDRRVPRWLIALGLMTGRPAMPYCVFMPAVVGRIARRRL